MDTMTEGWQKVNPTMQGWRKCVMRMPDLGPEWTLADLHYLHFMLKMVWTSTPQAHPYYTFQIPSTEMLERIHHMCVRCKGDVSFYMSLLDQILNSYISKELDF